MTAMQMRVVGVAILAAVVAILMNVVKGGDMASGGSSSPEALARQNQLETDAARSRARFDAGAYILRSKQLSEHEELKLIVIPEGYVEDLDTRCVVYQDSELRTSTITCNGIKFRSLAP